MCVRGPCRGMLLIKPRNLQTCKGTEDGSGTLRRAKEILEPPSSEAPAWAGGLAGAFTGEARFAYEEHDEAGARSLTR